MGKVAYKGGSVNSVTASGHIDRKYWNSSYCSGGYIDGVCQGWSGGYYSYGTSNATVNGDIKNGSSNVYVNGNSVARNGDSVTETDTFSLPSGWSQDGSHSGGTGQISSGVSSVYANGSKLAIVGTSVATHASVSTTIKDGSSNVYAS